MFAIHRWCVQAVQLAGLRPDEWTVESGDVGDGDEAEEEVDAPTQVKQLQLEFWNAAKKALLETGAWASLRTTRPQYWYDLPLGRSGVHLTATANTSDKRIGVKVTLMPETAKAALSALLAQREAIEKELGFALTWDPHPAKRMRTIKVVKECDVLDRATWPEAIQWIAQTAKSLHTVFGPRVAALELEPDHDG